MSAKDTSATRAITTTLLVSVGDVLLSLFTAIFTGSTVALAQTFQSMTDIATPALLLFGIKRSRHRANRDHPLGFGRELFFWVLVSSTLTLFSAGFFSILFGLNQVLNPQEITLPWLAFGVLAFGLVTNSYSMQVSIGRLRQSKSTTPVWRRITHSSLIETKTTLLIDLFGTISAFLGLFALLLFLITGNAVFDGLGSMAIGIGTGVGALLLINDLREFIVGRSVDQDVVDAIKATIATNKHVYEVINVRVTIIGSEQQEVVAHVHFKNDLNTDQIERSVATIKKTIMHEHPTVRRVTIGIAF